VLANGAIDCVLSVMLVDPEQGGCRDEGGDDGQPPSAAHSTHVADEMHVSWCTFVCARTGARRKSKKYVSVDAQCIRHTRRLHKTERERERERERPA